MTPLPDDAIHPLTRAECATWLRDHHATSAGVWLATAKTAPTRARRVAQTVTNCAAGRRFDHWTKETR